MARHDFIIDYDPDHETKQDLALRIIDYLFWRRVENNKPCIVLVTGDSGEGKSMSVLKILEERLKRKHKINLKDILDDLVIYTPFEYSTKYRKLLVDPLLKKIKSALVDESRELVSAKDYNSFTNKTISYVNATSRAINPMVIFFLTQSVLDMDASIRRTVTYKVSCERPIGQKVRFIIYKIVKNDFDIEKPKLIKRRIKGLIRVKKNGETIRRIYYKPIFRLKMPSKEVKDKYQESDRNKKLSLIQKKFDAMISKLKSEYEKEDKKVDRLVKFYKDKPETFPLVLKRSRGKIMLTKEFELMHELGEFDKKEFIDRIKGEFEKKEMVKSAK